MTTASTNLHGGPDLTGPVTYQVGASSPTGLWLGLTAPALALLGIGLLLSVLAALIGLPFGLSIVPIALTASLALLPCAGRPLHAWTGPAASHVRNRLGGRTQWCPPPPAQRLIVPPHCASSGLVTVQQPDHGFCRVRLRLPAEYGHPYLLGHHADPDAAVGADGPGLLVDSPAGVVTIVFVVAGVDRFALLDSTEQDRLLAGWGSALTLLSRDPAVRRVQLLDRQSPHPRLPEASSRGAEIADAPRDPTADRQSPAGPASRADEDYQALQAQVRALTVRRDSLLVVQLRLDAFGTTQCGAGADRRAREWAGMLTAARERAQHLSTQLLAGQLLTRPLGPAELTATLAGFLSCQPASPEPPSASWGTDAADGLLIGSRRNAWDHVRLDDTWHRSYAITDWPRTPSTGTWLAPLLLASPPGCASTFTVHLEPIGSAQAARLARSARTRADLDLADRHKLGLPPSAAADLTAEGAAGMDAELVAGHSAHRLSALLTCSAPCLGQLETGSLQLQEAAQAARLGVRPLHGQHHLALAATMPLARIRSAGLS